MAIGSSRAHSSVRDPGNLHIVTSQAVAMPRMPVPSATMTARASVFASISGSVVAARWRSVAPSAPPMLATTPISGAATTSAIPQHPRRQGVSAP